MKVSILQMYLMFWITIFSLNAQTNERYIEVTCIFRSIPVHIPGV